MATTRELSVQFSVDAMVRDYHAYQSVREAVVGEELACQFSRGQNFCEWPLGRENCENFFLAKISRYTITINTRFKGKVLPVKEVVELPVQSSVHCNGCG